MDSKTESDAGLLSTVATIIGVTLLKREKTSLATIVVKESHLALSQAVPNVEMNWGEMEFPKRSVPIAVTDVPQVKAVLVIIWDEENRRAFSDQAFVREWRLFPIVVMLKIEPEKLFAAPILTVRADSEAH